MLCNNTINKARGIVEAELERQRKVMFLDLDQSSMLGLLALLNSSIICLEVGVESWNPTGSRVSFG
jgi:hypothetical protein